jgi:hypothetical protein
VNQRVRSEARGTVAYPARGDGSASLKIKDEHLAIGGDQHRHVITLPLNHSRAES